MASAWKEREREINAPFVDELRGAISRSRLTPTEVARRAGFSQSQMSEWLTGATSITLGRFVALAHAAGFSTKDISEMVERADGVLRSRQGAPAPGDRTPASLDVARTAKAEREADAVKAREARGEERDAALGGIEDPDHID